MSRTDLRQSSSRAVSDDCIVRTRELFRRCDETDSAAERERLHAEIVLLNRGLAERIASHYRRRGIPLDDLQQVAYLGLCKAVARFRTAEGVAFGSFAGPTIYGEIKRHFRDHGWMVRVPRRVQELRTEMWSVEEELMQRLGRSPTVPEMAAAVNAAEETVIEAIAAVSCYSPVQLELPSEDGHRTFGDVVLVEQDALSRSDARLVLAPVIEGLADREKELLRLRYFEGLTQAQIGDRLGLSQMQISRLLSNLLARMREQLGVTLAA